MAYAVVNSKFNPFSYDELVKPFNTYSSAYEKQQAVAEALATQAASLEDLSPDLDSTEYQTYSNWKNQLKAVSDELATSGLSPETRERLRNLNLSYNTDLSPVLDKLKTRSELIKEQRTIQAKNPNSVFFDTDYSVTPIGQISSASTYNTYNVEDIMKEVGNDVYSKMNSGEAVPSTSEYLTRYAAGLSDEDKIQRINNAILSGVSLGSSTYQQKEFDNYINRVRATRTAGGSGTRTTPGSGVPSAMTYEGTAITPSYDKTTKKYKIKNKNKQDVILPDNFTEEDLRKAFYGGEYGYVDIFGTTVPRVQSTEEGPNGSKRTVYSIYTGKDWVTLPKGGNTTKRELYKMLTKENLSALTADEKQRRMGAISNEDIEKNISKGRWTREEVDYHDYAPYLTDALVKKMDALESVGAVFNTTIYRDRNGQLVGWDIVSTGDDIDRPIEYQDNWK